MSLREKIEGLKERLLDPFDVEGLDREFEELLEMMSRAEPGEIKGLQDEFEEVRKLVKRNMEIISGSIKPLVEKVQDGILSRRV